MQSPPSHPHSPRQLEALLKQSDSDSFVFPESTVDQEESKLRIDPVKEMLDRMEANKAFSRLYRTTSYGTLVQVVRRREFGPLATIEMQKVKLTDPRESQSPTMMMENGRYPVSRDDQSDFRYPYWRFLPKQKGLSGPLLRSLGSNVNRRGNFNHRRTGSLGQQSDWKRPSIILPQVKVRKRVPSLDQLGQTGKDLGIDLGNNFAQRFQTFSSHISKAKACLTPVPSTRQIKSGKRSEKKQFATPIVSARSQSKKDYDPEDFRRERQLTEQAKALFMSGAFSNYYHKERESADKEMLGWLKYC